MAVVLLSNNHNNLRDANRCRRGSGNGTATTTTTGRADTTRPPTGRTVILIAHSLNGIDLCGMDSLGAIPVRVVKGLSGSAMAAVFVHFVFHGGRSTTFG